MTSLSLESLAALSQKTALPLSPRNMLLSPPFRDIPTLPSPPETPEEQNKDPMDVAGSKLKALQSANNVPTASAFHPYDDVMGKLSHATRSTSDYSDSDRENLTPPRRSSSPSFSDSATSVFLSDSYGPPTPCSILTSAGTSVNNSTDSILVASDSIPHLEAITEVEGADTEFPIESPVVDAQPKNLDELVSFLHRELAHGGLGADNVNVDKIIAAMEFYQSNANDWQPYCHFDKCKYTRNLVDDGNGYFNLMLLAWNTDQQSAIHDHAGAHCIMKILDGQLIEQRYAFPKNEETNGPLEPFATSPLNVNQVAYIHDRFGLHRVSNPSTDRPAVSLHLYCPPFDYCKTFEEKTGVARPSAKCTFYTKRGKKVNPLEE